MPTTTENKKASPSPWKHTADQILSNFKAGWTPREQQVFAIRKIASAFAAGKRIVAVEMPTGGGKTPLAVAVADTVRGEGGSYMITSQLGLMDQYVRDYPAPHMELLKGRANYACTHPEADPGMDAGHGVCHKMGKGIIADCVNESMASEDADMTPLQQAASLLLPPEAHACPYWKQLQKANDAKLSLFNFSSFLFQRRIGRFQKRALLIVDECFVAGTKVTLSNGETVPIESVGVGDEVKNAVGCGTVYSTSKKTSRELYEVRCEDGAAFKVTGNHPVFTTRGWCAVKDLGVGEILISEEGLRLLREGILPKAMGLEEVSECGGSAVGTKLEGANLLLSILHKEASESYAQSFIQKKNEQDPQKNRPSTHNSGRERKVSAEAGVGAFRNSNFLEIGVSNPHWGTSSQEALPDLLQGRPGEPKGEGRDRSGWSEPSFHGKAREGQEEGFVSAFPRVASVSRLEREGPQTVYNLSVTGHPSYFAEGKLVHNCHGIEGQLQNYVTLELSEWALRLINLEIDREITSKEQFLEWLRANNVASKIAKAIEGSKEKTEDTSVDFSKEEADALRELDGKIANFMRYLEMTEWILETVKYQTRRGDSSRKIVARPLYVKAFANDLLFSHAERVIVMSATILDAKIWAESLGIKPEELEHVVTACDFPAKNRPIYLEFAGNLGSKHFSPQANPKNPTKPKFIQKVKQLLDRHQGQRGIIHCHSFEFSKVLREEVASKRFLFQDDFGGDKQLMISMHASNEDSVIVAPAMSEGFDFKDGLARWQIVAKIPWPSLGDKVIKERAARDDRFYGWLTALKIVQSYGRIVRHDEDWGTTYIIDQGFEFFLYKHGKMFPQWMKDAFKKYPPKPEDLRRG